MDTIEAEKTALHQQIEQGGGYCSPKTRRVRDLLDRLVRAEVLTKSPDSFQAELIRKRYSP